MFCQIKYTPQPKAWAYPEAMRKQALQLYVDGMNLRRIARHLGVHHRTVSLWVQAQAAQLPNPPVPSEVKEAEMDELFTFIGDKKTKSTSSPSSIASPAAIWASKWSGSEPKR
jgi:transposase-like protein